MFLVYFLALVYAKKLPGFILAEDAVLFLKLGTVRLSQQ